jgi:hypothetical protein
MQGISDADVRTMIRESIARHFDGQSDAAPALPVVHVGAHASHVRLAVSAGSEGEGTCLIEPAVRCNHCGYCQSYGH